MDNKEHYKQNKERIKKNNTEYVLNNYAKVQKARRKYYKENQLDYTWRLKRLLSASKNRAKVKNFPHNIDYKYLIKLWESNQECCALTGQLFDLSSWGEKGQVNPRSPSIDRIKPKLGYVKGNVRLITYHMNVALTDFGTEEFEKLAKLFLAGV